jgi:hypothetical protein
MYYSNDISRINSNSNSNSNIADPVQTSTDRSTSQTQTAGQRSSAMGSATVRPPALDGLSTQRGDFAVAQETQGTFAAHTITPIGSDGVAATDIEPLESFDWGTAPDVDLDNVELVRGGLVDEIVRVLSMPWPAEQGPEYITID